MPHSIKTYPFPTAAASVAAAYHGTNWPVVYIIHNDDELYVGETTSAYVRYGQHADSKGKNYKDRRKLNKIEIIFDDSFHKSAILDIEQSLIQLFEADNAIQEEKNLHAYKLQNKNGGQSSQHDYYNRSVYQSQLEDIWKDLIKLKLANNEYNDIRNSDLFKYSPYSSLTSEQEQVCRDIIRDIMATLLSGKKGTAILKGAAGTGKSLVLINMITTLINSQKVNYDFDPDSEEAAEISDRLKLHKELEFFFKEWKKITGLDNLKIGFVVPMDSIRSTFQAVFVKTKSLRGNMVIAPNEVVHPKDSREYDVVFVDEAHRLKQRKGMSGVEYGAFDSCCASLNLNPSSATNLDFLLKKTKYQVMVYDENQTVKSADIPAAVFKSKITSNHRHYIEKELKSQMRCMGGGDFIDYVNSIFNGSATKKTIRGYEFKLFDDPNALIDYIIKMDSKESLCRTLAGYSWPWISSKKKVTSKDGKVTYKKSDVKFKDLAEIKAAGRDCDIELNGKKYYWNVNNKRWIINSSPEEIGCIHTTQGYDLNRVGVIFGKEIDYDPVKKELVINEQEFYDTKVKEDTPAPQLRQYIINAYKVMLVRGIKGCYVYACNKNLQDYLKKFIDTV